MVEMSLALSTRAPVPRVQRVLPLASDPQETLNRLEQVVQRICRARGSRILSVGNPFRGPSVSLPEHDVTRWDYRFSGSGGMQRQEERPLPFEDDSIESGKF